jgi:hypothetical protein
VTDKEGDELLEEEEDSALLQDLKRRFGKPKRFKRISPSRYVLSPMGDTNFYIGIRTHSLACTQCVCTLAHSFTALYVCVCVCDADAEDDYFSYEQASHYGYAEEGGRFKEKPHKVRLCRRNASDLSRELPFSCARAVAG